MTSEKNPLLGFAEAEPQNFAWSFDVPRSFAPTAWMTKDGVDAPELWMGIGVTLRYLRLPEEAASVHDLTEIPDDWFKDIAAGQVWTPVYAASRNAAIANLSEELSKVLEDAAEENPDMAKYLYKSLGQVIEHLRESIPASLIKAIEDQTAGLM